MVTPYYVELWAQDTPDSKITFNAIQPLNGLGISKDGVEGWDSTPQTKITATERGQGDGGHDISQDSVLYAARTVTLHYNAVADDRDTLHDITDSIRALAHKLVTLRVVDGVRDTYCKDGYIALSQTAKWHENTVEDSSLTIVFERPERLSTASRGCQLIPQEYEGGLGLSYGDTGQGLDYPLDFGTVTTMMPNSNIVRNDGTSRAYPIYTVYGSMPHGVELDFPSVGQSLICTQPVGAVPLILDTRTRTASIGGLDVSRTITQRGWQTIPPHDSLRVTLSTIGSGYVNIDAHDTYM